MKSFPKHGRLFILLLISIPCSVRSLHEKIDEDTWWHLRTGEWIVEHGKVPFVDPFSRLEPQREWFAYSWGYELILWLFHHFFGLYGILLFRSLLIFCVFFLLAKRFFRDDDQNATRSILLIANVLAFIPLTTERSWHFTIAFTIITLGAIEKLRAGVSIRKFWWMPLLYCLWSNIHIQFVMGLCLIGSELLLSLLDKIQASQQKVIPIRAISLLGIGCFLGTLCNPYHLQLWGVIFDYATQVVPLRHIQELRPPDFTLEWNWLLVLVLLTALIQVIRNGFQRREVLYLALAVFFSMRMQRDIWFGMLLGSSLLLPFPNFDSKPSIRFITIIAIYVASFGLILLLLLLTHRKAPTIREKQKEYYPVKAIEFIRENQLPGPLFNHFSWGGFLIDNLQEYPVSIDGRTNVYGDQLLLRSIETWAAKNNWESDPMLQTAKLLIAPYTQALPNELENHGWRKVYQDETAMVFVREES